jgi:DnaJ-class molecular chaperone
MPIPKRPKRKCGTCKGKGTIKEWTVDRKGKKISYDKICPTCNGNGET